jgi:hypothetical protein
MPEQKKPVKPGPDGFVQLEITSPDPWNFALNIDPAHLTGAVGVHTAPLPAGSPFQPDASPVTLSVSGKRVPSWGMNWTGRAAEDPPLSPLSSDEPEQTVTLVPFGAQTLRVTAFPWLGEPAPPAAKYHCDFHDTDAPGWITYGGSWHVEDGRWCAPADTGTAGVKAVASGTDFADFTYDADVIPASSGDTGLIFRVTRPSLGDNAFDGYYVGVSPSGSQILLGKTSASSNAWTPLAAATLAVQAGAPIHIRVVAAADKIRVFARGITDPILSISDKSFAHGAIGVRRYATEKTSVPASFTNLSVISAPSPQP